MNKHSNLTKDEQKLLKVWFDYEDTAKKYMSFLQRIFRKKNDYWFNTDELESLAGFWHVKNVIKQLNKKKMLQVRRSWYNNYSSGYGGVAYNNPSSIRYYNINETGKQAYLNSIN